MNNHVRMACLAGLTVMAGCNESASDKLPARLLVLDGHLVVTDTAASMGVSVGKQGSTVVVVMEGGDYLRATDGSTEQRMDYSSDLFGSYYRATFSPVDLDAVYAINLYRAAEGASYRSEFPAIPSPFAITQPSVGQTFSLASTPTLVLSWDNTIAAGNVRQTTSVACDWNLEPAPLAPNGNPVRSMDQPSRMLTALERSQRQVTLNLAAAVSRAKANAVAQNPTGTGAPVATLLGCDVKLDLLAASESPAGAGLSAYGKLTASRSKSVEFSLVP